MQKKYFYKTLFLFLLGIFILASLIIYIDPFQQFKVNEYGNGEQRIINTGIAKNGNYKLIVLGTSVSENFLKKDLEKEFNLKSVNLALSGSTNFEQRNLLKLIVEKNQVNTILYGLDVFSFNRNINEVRSEIPKYACENNYFEKIKYLISYDSFKGLIKSFIRPNPNWIDRHSYWGDNFRYSENNTLSMDSKNQWGAQNLGAIRVFKNGYSIDKMRANFDELYKLLKENPDIKYKIYFPPYASIWWYYADKYNCLNSIFEFKQYIISKLINEKNIELYDFQQDISTTSNLNNYKDMVHYGPKINKQIICHINNKDYLIKSDNINSKEILKKQIEIVRLKYSSILK